MKAIICGAGQVGYSIARQLIREKLDITMIDISPELVQEVQDKIDARALVGNASHPDVLAAAGADEADMLIAVTQIDEVNMVACQVAHSLFNVPTKIARIRSQVFLQNRWKNLFSRDHLPIDYIISPEIAIAETILRRMGLTHTEDSALFGDGLINLLEMHCPASCPILNTPLSQLTDLFPELEALVVGYKRKGVIKVSHSDYQIKAGDTIYIIVSTAHLHRTMGIFGHQHKQLNRVVIAGGGNIGRYVAQQLEKRTGAERVRVTVIERNTERAGKIADSLQRTIVLRGDALNEDILREAGISAADSMVAVTHDDHVNLLSCVMAYQMGVSSTMALVNNPSYNRIALPLGVDERINPRSITVSEILKHVRRGRIRAVYPLDDGKAEIIEAEALQTNFLVGKKLKTIELGESIRFGAILRHGKVIMPHGELEIQPRDRAVLFSLAHAVHDVERLFRVSIDFF